jgi:mannose-1-phosphate guanylyltransferase
MNLLPELPEENVLIEPQGKNTAPSLILSTATIFLKNPEAVVAALPADHLIKDSPLFLKKLEAGASLAQKEEFLVTLGITPVFPATGYGYIQFSKGNPQRISEEAFFSVDSFKEKPNLKQAQAFLKTDNFFWNSGIFIWRANVFARKLKEYAPALYIYWKKILNAIESNDKAGISDIYGEIPSVSIDYALMEKAKGVFVCEGNFGWSDVGSWSSLMNIWEKNQQGNTIKGEGIALDSENCLVYNPEKITALIGVKDIVVVDTPDALLVCHKNSDQKVRDIIDIIKKKHKTEYL